MQTVYYTFLNVLKHSKAKLSGLKNNVIDMSSDVFQERHNEFIDSIFSRINRIVRENYDPFVVPLNTRPALKESASGTNNSISATNVKTTTKATTKKGKNPNGNRHSTTTRTVVRPTKKLKNTKSEPRALEESAIRSDPQATLSAAAKKVQSKLQEQLQRLQNLGPAEQTQQQEQQKQEQPEKDLEKEQKPKKEEKQHEEKQEKPKQKSDEKTSKEPKISKKPTEAGSDIASGSGIIGNANRKSENKIEAKTEKSTAIVSTTAKPAISDKIAKLPEDSAPELRTVHVSSQKKTSSKNHQKTSATKKVQNNAAQSAGNKNQQTQQQKVKKAGSTYSGASNSGGNNHAGKEVEKLQKAEGSLSGLATLKRVGNVKVIADTSGRNSTIKAKFTLGPLILRVEKSYKRGSVRNVKSASARTNEMIGRIKFSVVDDRAMLMSIKVQQPKQVEVESKDLHDNTRELIWRRTPKLAKLVTEKLKLAAESVFTPRGVEVVRL